VDFAPTMLSLAGITVPKHLQGQAFLGSQKARKPRDYIYGAKDRIDEAPDLTRAVHDRKYSYVRNFMWHVPYSVNMNYMDQMPSMQEMRRLNAEGKLKGAEQLYFLPRRPVEELYDLEKDPYEINNLAGNPRNKNVVLRMRKELKRWISEIEDVGLIPEPDFDAMKRPGDKYELTAEPSFVPQKSTSPEKGQLVEIICPTPGASIEYRIEGRKKKSPWLLYNKPVTIKPGQVISAKAGRIGFKDSKKVQHRFGEPRRRQVQAQAKKAHWRDQLAKTDVLKKLLRFKDIDFEGAGGIPKCFEALNDKYGSVRYWAVIGLHNLCENHADIQKAKAAIGKLLNDDSWSVKIAAAHALCDWGEQKKGLPVLMEAIEDSHASTRHFAMVALEQIGNKARPALATIKAKLKDGYAGRVAGRIVAKL
ncbi:MAG: HEAT repeat domain-containing protein, partial [Sedimentisphaerales bacterium]|nr:HEAT repeat domain-containing protein [Sedimentisphaerales bacterium]